MRGIFGLAGVLVVCGVIIWFMNKGGLEHTSQTIKAGESAREQVNRIGGNDPDTGQRASESAVLEALTPGSRFTGLLVARVTQGGAYEKYFGIARNDTIIATEYQGAKFDMKSNSDVAMAKAQVDEAYRKQGSIYVVRDGRELKLPAARSGQPAPQRDALQQQLEAIKSVPQ
jgi:hypothetical protein